jgi:hypothetical protein
MIEIETSHFPFKGATQNRALYIHGTTNETYHNLSFIKSRGQYLFGTTLYPPDKVTFALPEPSYVELPHVEPRDNDTVTLQQQVERQVPPKRSGNPQVEKMKHLHLRR